MAISRFNNAAIILIFTLLISCSEDKNSLQDISNDNVSANPTTQAQVQSASQNLVDTLNRKETPQPQNDTNKYIQVQVPVEDIEPVEISDDDLKLLKETGKAPFVANFRNALNDFFNGKRESDYFERSAVDALGDNLSTFNPNYYKSKFFILSVNEDYPVGGIFMDVLFKDMPDKVFTIWMFETDNTYKLRMFEQNISYNDAEIKATLRLFGNVFKHKDIAF
ncbi:MAG: hypothetical protein KIT33_02355 [Candidatus Kapabacteria bacterium]|nr:hypothetical protein [Ignavibacteriota bacterium]MCW5883792.1 hypothetical protein [Candidatus Kapabacteria bacterium]